MQPEWILIPILVFVAIILVLLLRRPSYARCPQCGRRRAPGEPNCRSCGHTYSIAKQLVDAQTMQHGVPYITIVTGPASGQTVPITSDQFTIGRSATSQFRIEGELVSRYHAMITHQNEMWALYDRDSTNGTWVGGRRIAQHVLQPGDQIQVGPAVFVFQLAGAPVRAQPVQVVEDARISTPSPDAVARQVHALANYQLTPITGGVGGAARVYKGVSQRDGSVVAVKMLYQNDPYLRTKFEQEGRKIGLLLRHPHIAEVYHYGQAGDGSFYIIMEYAANGSLRQKIPTKGLSLNEAIRITGEVCDALEYAHRQRIVHRDVKPENILFSAQDSVKLVDFGIAKIAGARTVTQDGMIIGTPYYMSFEQAKGRQVDPRSDIYSLGIVLYEMLTGVVPFTGDPLTVVHQHITQVPTPPRRLNPSIPARTEKVILKALDKNINKRYRSAEQMAQALGYSNSKSPARVEKEQFRPIPAVQQDQRHTVIRLVDPTRGYTLSLPEGQTVLRRKEINSSDGQISREHARVIRDHTQLWLEDMESTNGSFLNGQRIFEPSILRLGDEIRIGNTTLRVQS